MFCAKDVGSSIFCFLYENTLNVYIPNYLNHQKYIFFGMYVIPFYCVLFSLMLYHRLKGVYITEYTYKNTYYCLRFWFLRKWRRFKRTKSYTFLYTCAFTETEIPWFRKLTQSSDSANEIPIYLQMKKTKKIIITCHYIKLRMAYSK